MGDEHVGLGHGIVIQIEKFDERLDLPESKVAEIKRNLHSSSQRRESYFDLYATGHPCPSWRQVAKTLFHVGLLHQAATVESTYAKGTRIIPMHTLSVTIIGFVIT